MRAYFSELLNSLRNNKLRTALTGFSIAWGIIILVVMLGAGKGVENGIRQMSVMTGVARQEIKITLSYTTKPYAGFKEDRALNLLNEQIEYLNTQYKDQVEAIVPQVIDFCNVSTNYGSDDLQVKTISEEQQSFNKLELLQGRLFTPQDHKNGLRKIILSENAISRLFAKDDSPIGQLVSIYGVSYEVIGIVKTDSPYFGNAYYPFTTYANIYPNSIIKITQLMVYPKIGSSNQTEALTKNIKNDIYTMLKVDPTDDGALYTFNAADRAKFMDKVFMLLQVLLWVMGIGSLSVGTIGVSNIMYVTVQERMREIGIRKAIGAKPKDIMKLVLGESVLLSLLSGIIGLLIGIGIVQLLGYLAIINHWGEEMVPSGPGMEMKLTFFSNPEVNMGMAIGALIVLVIAGLVAGRGPARKAIKVPAIVAMRDLK